jgi:hypothetical protein
MSNEILELINKFLDLEPVQSSDYHRITIKNLINRFIRRIDESKYDSPGYTLKVEYVDDQVFKPVEGYTIIELEKHMIWIAGKSEEMGVESLLKSMLYQYYEILVKGKDGFPKYDLKIFDNKSKFKPVPLQTQEVTGETTPTSVKSFEGTMNTWASRVAGKPNPSLVIHNSDIVTIKQYRSITYTTETKFKYIDLFSKLNFDQEVKYWRGDRLNNQIEQSTLIIYRRMEVTDFSDLCEMFVVLNNLNPGEISNNISLIKNMDIIKEKLSVHNNQAITKDKQAQEDD